MDKKHKQRNKTLQEINEWCYGRTSHLSLTGNEQAAQALTEEHMETLKNAKPDNMLWVST